MLNLSLISLNLNQSRSHVELFHTFQLWNSIHTVSLPFTVSLFLVEKEERALPEISQRAVHSIIKLKYISQHTYIYIFSSIIKCNKVKDLRKLDDKNSSSKVNVDDVLFSLSWRDLNHNHKYSHTGRTIYEWEQSLDEVTIFITPPPGVKSKDLNIKITSSALSVGLKAADKPFIHEKFFSNVKPSTSTWFLDDGVIEISLHKVKKAETWLSALQGHGQMDPFTQGEMKKKIMLERFQEEHPGFDFSGAEFSGDSPDPRKFMGGVKHV